jgi:hypothetical protein
VFLLPNLKPVCLLCLLIMFNHKIKLILLIRPMTTLFIRNISKKEVRLSNMLFLPIITQISSEDTLNSEYHSLWVLIQKDKEITST